MRGVLVRVGTFAMLAAATLVQGFMRPLMGRSSSLLGARLIAGRAPMRTPASGQAVFKLFSTEAGTAPEATQRLKVEWKDDSTAVLTWEARAPSHKVKYTREGGVYNAVAVGGEGKATLRGLEPGAKYAVQVYSITPAGTTTTAGGDGDVDAGRLTLVAESSLETQKTAVAPGTEAAAAAPKAEVTELSRLEIRVGRIVEIGPHPDADTLYVEKVDVGEPEPRTIVSGLVKYQTVEQLQGRDVIVLCNLKPRAMRGVTSHGMLLCASNEDHSVVEPLSPPAGTPVGELITFEGHAAQPEPAGNRATKAFDRISADLFSTDDKLASYKGTPFMTTKGPVTAAMKGSIS